MDEAPRMIPSLGSRGEGWVVIQTVLLVAVAATGVVGSRWPEDLRVPTVVLALVLGIAGLWLTSSGFGTLGESLSPFPRPRRASELKEDGIYARVRHPIYGGLLLVCLAWSLALSPMVLVPAAALAVTLALKSRLEERWLIERHPTYATYRERVRHRLVPYLW